MKVTVLDFETYYSPEYTLKKMTTEAYIRDERFKTHCVSVVSNDGTKKVFTENIAENLAPYMDGFIIAHHAQFDGLILSHHYGLYPKYWGCTLSMARAQLQFLKSHSLSSLCKHFELKEKTIDYNAFRGKRDLDPATTKMLTEGCIHDSELTLIIAEKFLETLPPEELQIIDLTIRMFTEPALALDSPRLTIELARVRKSKADALEALNVDKKDLASSKKFGVLLEAQGVEVPMKISPTTGKDIPALAKTDAGMKELLEHENETVSALASARLGVKSTLLETRCVRLIGMASRGALTVYLKYYGAHTGRWSGGDKVNFQNLTAGSELRKSILAPEGYKLIIVDSAQIECRLLNWFAKQNNIVEAFREGRDIYCENASKFFNLKVTKKKNNDNGERDFGKVMELSCGYGVGAVKFRSISLQQAKRKISYEESQRAINLYRGGHPKVVGLWRCFGEVIKNMGKGLPPYEIGCVTVDGYKIIMPNGTFLDYTGLRWNEDEESYLLGKKRRIYGGLVVENIIQKLGRLIITNVIIKVADKYNYKLATTTHDDLIYVVPEDDEEALENIKAEMVKPPHWCLDIPLGVDGFESERFDK